MEGVAEDRGVVARHFSRRLQIDMVGDGVLVGAIVGLVITCYRVSLSTAEGVLRGLRAFMLDKPLVIAGWFAALALIALVVARLMRYEPDTRGSGIPQVDAEVMGRLDMRHLHVLVVKFLEGVLCTLSGLSLGREGPSVLLGGMAGKGVSRALDKDRGEEHLLVTCGAAAGMSAAFHAPLAGVLFALEEIHREFNAPLVISAMASTAAADFVSSRILGMQPVLRFELVGTLPHADYLFVLVIGLVCGVVGALHNVGMFALQERVFGGLRRRIGDGVLALAFLGAGIATLFAPELLCGGDAILEHLESSPETLSVVGLLALLAGKYIFTSICFAAGAPGGTLLPLVIMGALVGAIMGMGAVGYAGMPLSYLNNFTLLGVAGMFAASVRAPVTAVVLCFELAGTLENLLAATAVSIVAYVTANLLKVDPFYEHLLGGLLLSQPLEDASVDRGALGEKVLHTHVVGVGSMAEGKALADIPWPEGTLVVTIDRAGLRVVPQGSTILQALDELLLIMDGSHEAETEELLHDICGTRAHHTKQRE